MKKHNLSHIHRILVRLLALAGLLSVNTASAALTDPAQIQTEAYVNLVQADQSLDAGRLEEALTQYQIARDYYAQLAKDFPSWEPRVIQYRTTYCANQIADIQRQPNADPQEELPELEPLPTPPSAQPVSSPPAPVIVAPPPPELAPALDRTVEIDYLKSRLASLETQLAECDAVQNELASITAQNEQLKKDVAAAQQQLGERAQSEQSAQEGLRTEMANQAEQLQTLQTEIESKKQLDQALNDLEGQVNNLRAENDRLKNEMKNLGAELDSAEVRADQAELKIQQAQAQQIDAEANSPKPLDSQAHAEKELAALPSQSRFAPPPAELNPAPPLQATPASKTKLAEKQVAEPKAEPKPIPSGMSAADFVRQLLQQGDNHSALATVREARKSKPSDMNLPLIEGIALIRLQRYSEAAAMLIDLARNNPRNAEVHATLGAAMMGAGLYKEARETLLMAIKLDRNLPECHYNLAQLYAFIDPVDLKLARRYYKQARVLGLTADPQLENALK